MKLFHATVVVVFLVLSFLLTHTALASTTAGSIDPSNTGSYFTAFVHVPSISGSQIINFGKFSLESHYDITITDAGLRGFAWGNEAGWIVVNCADTTSGCSSTNANFKVAVSANGTLSGYAWGQKTGWINFGPFLNNNTAQVQINQSGQFNGYAWSQRYGWIVFDCSNGATCVTTDYIPLAYRQTGGGGGTTSSPSNTNKGGGPALPTASSVFTPPANTNTIVQPPFITSGPGTSGTGNSLPPLTGTNQGSGKGYVTQPVSPPSITITSTPSTSEKPPTTPHTKIQQSASGSKTNLCPSTVGLKKYIVCWFVNLGSSFHQSVSVPIVTVYEKIKLFILNIKF